MEYINIWKYKDEHYPFQIFIGGRGTGKTYSALEGCLNGKIEDNKKFILMRRTAQEMDLQYRHEDRPPPTLAEPSI